MKEIKPYNTNSSKKKEIEKMFNNIAKSYDILNSLLSFNIDKWWRKKFIQNIRYKNPKYILDVATGTGDIPIEIAKKNINSKIIGFDISHNMIQIAKNKINKIKLQDHISFIRADVDMLPFSNNTFDIVTVAFGIRNFENLQKSFSEILRVLKKNGELHILEFSTPKNFMKYIFKFYLSYILPKIGYLISKDLNAYSYLSNSINLFPYGEQLKKILKNIGYHNIKYQKLTCGIVTLYKGVK